MKKWTNMLHKYSAQASHHLKWDFHHGFTIHHMLVKPISTAWRLIVYVFHLIACYLIFKSFRFVFVQFFQLEASCHLVIAWLKVAKILVWTMERTRFFGKVNNEWKVRKRFLNCYDTISVYLWMKRADRNGWKYWVDMSSDRVITFVSNTSTQMICKRKVFGIS